MLTGYTVTDQQTKQQLAATYRKTGYVADPHGAVYRCFFQYKSAGHTHKAIFLETAHPIKFPATVEEIIGHELPLPASVQAIMQKPKEATLLPNSYAALKEYLLYSR